MTTAPSVLSYVRSVDRSQVKHGVEPVKYLAKSNVDFRAASRREDSNKLRAAFDGPTQSAIAEKASRAMGVSPRQIINWMQCENDMPSWAVKAVEHYLRRVERVARKIEGDQ